MNTVEISSTCTECDIEEGKVHNFCQKVLEYLNIDNWEISILFCDDVFIHELNKRFRKIDSATDILSFSQQNIQLAGDIHYAGDIVISVETLGKNSKLFKVPKEEELKRLLIHGVLHLLGMQHTENEDDNSMVELQEKVLKTLTMEKVF